MRISTVVILVFAFVLSACKQTEILYADLNEREANEILALLYSAGLPAEKNRVSQKSGNKVKYSVATQEASFAKAMMLLQANDLPRERFITMGEMFEKSGIVSSELEETARLNYALSEKLSDTLSRIDGVRVARVHLALPKKRTLTTSNQASSASVFIKHRENVNLERDLTKIKTLVVDSIENLRYEDVTVVFFAEKNVLYPVQTPKKKPILNPITSEQTVLSMQIMDWWNAILVVFIVLLAMIGSFLIRKTQIGNGELNIDRLKQED